MPLAQSSRLPSSATTARLRPGSGSGVWRAAAERRAPVAVRQQLRRGRVGNVEDRQAAVAPRRIGEVAGDDRVVQRVALAGPARRLAGGLVHPRQPEPPDHLGPGRVLHVDDRQHMVGKALPVARGIGIAPADIPQPVQPQPVDRHKADLARLGRFRDVEHPQPGGEGLLALGEGVGDRGLEVVVGVGIALHHPDVRRIDRQQQVAMGLQVKGARVGRRGEETHRARVLRVAHVDDGKPVAEHMPDIGMALVHHDLHAVAVAVELVGADEIDVAGGIGGHRAAPVAALAIVPPILQHLPILRGTAVQSAGHADPRTRNDLQLQNG